MDAHARKKIVELFEKHRATPGAPYDDAHFLDFLLANPKSKGAVYNNFRGVWRFNAFVDDVQYEFAVCLSVKDRDANYPLAIFVSRVLELQKSRRGSLKSLDNQAKAGAGWQVLLLADFGLLIAAFLLRNSPFVIAAIIGIAVFLNSWFFRFAWRARTYLAALRTRIETADE